jgi:branched-subunit amino acid aminotransferase/4-amino-4-deoxychorismate lyase
MWILIDGQLQNVSNVQLNHFQPGIFSHRGLFETIVFKEGRILFLNQHLERMKRGLKYFGLKMFSSDQQIMKHIFMLIKRNKLSQARIRIILWKEGGRSHWALMTIPTKTIALKKRSQGISLQVATQRIGPIRTSHLKTLDYQIFYQAREEAKRSGYEDALLLNSKSEVVEAATANIFCICKSELRTPPISSGCLNGVIRAEVIKAARNLGIKVTVKPLQQKALLKADEVFVTNSLVEVLPVNRIDRAQISFNFKGSMSEKLFHNHCKLEGVNV